MTPKLPCFWGVQTEIGVENAGNASRFTDVQGNFTEDVGTEGGEEEVVGVE